MRRIRDAIALKPERVVLWLIAAYYVAAVLIRVLRSDGLQNDEAEQLFQSQFLLWGYGRQPPFYNWLQYGVVHLIGPSILAVSLVKNALLFLTCLFYGLAARQLSERPEVPAAAMLGVLALPVVTILAQRDLSHAVATLFAASLFLYAFFGALTKPALWRYALTGFAIGIGAIAKYNFVVLPVAALIAILPEPELRRRLFDRRMIATIVIAAAICLPHALWVLDNFRTATAGTVNALRDDATGSFVGDRLNGLVELAASVMDGAFVLILFLLIAFRRELIACWSVGTLWTRVVGRMFLLSLVVIAFVLLAMGATEMSQKWLSPFLLLLPLYLCLKLEAAGAFARRRGVAVLALPVFVLAFGFLVYLLAGNVLGPLIGKHPKDSLPTGAFMRQVLAERGPAEQPAFIIGGSRALVGSARIAAPRTPVLSPAFIQDLPLPGGQARGLIVWPGSDGPVLPPSIATYLAGLGIDPLTVERRAMDVPYDFSRGEKSETFNYAWITGP
jgi:4-amino-4-deoxy-L-arabinose transferase-like glycosyltransferase